MQKMSGKASAPIARDNDPVTPFAKEGKQPTGADTIAPKAPKAPKAAEPKPAKAEPKPKATPKTQQLAYVVQKQESEPHIGHILGIAIYVEQRMNAGQSEEDATRDVLALYRTHVAGLLAQARAADASVRVALQPYTERELPSVAARHTSYAV
jgi:hypothetical protein